MKAAKPAAVKPAAKRAPRAVAATPVVPAATPVVPAATPVVPAEPAAPRAKRATRAKRAPPKVEEPPPEEVTLPSDDEKEGGKDEEADAELDAVPSEAPSMPSDLSDFVDDDGELGEYSTTMDIPAEMEVVHVRVPDDERVTTNNMGVFAAAAIIAIRTEQIGRNGLAMIDTAGYNTSEEIARAELRAGRCPLIVRRHIGSRVIDGKLHKYYEMFKANDMIITELGI